MRKCEVLSYFQTVVSVSSPSVDMEDVTMTIKPVFDMEEDDESEEISEHGKREIGKYSQKSGNIPKNNLGKRRELERGIFFVDIR